MTPGWRSCHPTIRQYATEIRLLFRQIPDQRATRPRSFGWEYCKICSTHTRQHRMMGKESGVSRNRAARC